MMEGLTIFPKDRLEENNNGYEESMANFHLDFDPSHDSDLSDDEEEGDTFSDEDKVSDDDEEVDGDDDDKAASRKSSVGEESEMEESGDENKSDEEDDKLSYLPGDVRLQNLPAPKLGIRRKDDIKLDRQRDVPRSKSSDSPNPRESVEDKKQEAPDRRGVFRTFTMDSMRGSALLGFGKQQKARCDDEDGKKSECSRTRRGGRRTRGGKKEEEKDLSEETAPSRRGVLRTFTMDSMRGPALLGFGKKKEEEDENEHKKPEGAKTRRGGRRNRGGTKEEDEQLDSNEAGEAKQAPSRRGVLRTFTMDSMRGPALLGFGKKKEEEDTSSAEEHKKPEGTRTRRGGRRNRGGTSEQETPSGEGAEATAPDQPPSRRGVLRTFTMDSMRGPALLGFGKKKEEQDPEEVDGQEHKKPEGARTRRGGRRNRGGSKEEDTDTNEASEPKETPSRRGVLRTFTMDSMRGPAIFGGRGKRRGGSDTENESSSDIDVKDSLTITKMTRRGGRRPNKKELVEEVHPDVTSDGEGSATTDGSNKTRDAEETPTPTDACTTLSQPTQTAVPSSV